MLDLADLPATGLDSSSLDPRERRRAQGLSGGAERRGYVVAHILLRELLSRRTGLAPEEVVYRREPCPSCGGPNGRPALDGHPRSLHFSMSRSGGLVLIGIASALVGVDVEVLPDYGVPSEVATLLHADERRAIFAAAPGERADVFARLWTRKEAYLKGIGTGVAHDLDAQYLGKPPHPAAPRGWTVLDIEVPAGWAAAAAVQSCGDERTFGAATTGR